MSTLPWFRVYTEMVDDERMRMLSFDDRWHYVAILCCKGMGLLDKQQDLALTRRQIGVKLGVDRVTLDEIERRLVEVGLIEADTLQPVAWDKRQFKSDSSSQRTAAWRDRERAKRHSDGLDTDTDDVEAIASTSRGKHEYTADFEQAWAAYPKRPGANKLEAFKAWKARLAKGSAVDDMTHGVMRYAAYCRVMRTEPRYIKQPATFFGPNLHFLEEWRVPAPSAVSAVKQSHRETWARGNRPDEDHDEARTINV